MADGLKSARRRTMGALDRILTIVVTATITSMVWIVAGGSLLDSSNEEGAEQIAVPSTQEPAADETLPEPVSEPRREVVLRDRGGATVPSSRELSQMIIPVRNVRPSELTDTFLAERGGGDRLHEAIDIMAPKGTAVIAAAPGTLERIFRSETGGNTLYVRSEDRRTIYYYAHLDRYAPGLEEDQPIRRGQRLGTVGSTGNAAPDAPHLHFAIMRTTQDAEWWEPTNAINPYPYLVGNAD